MLTRALGELASTIAQFRSELNNQEVASSATNALIWLQNRTNTWIPRSPDEGRPLRESIERMTGAIRGRPDKAGKEKLLQLISEDLQDKVAFCRTAGLTARQQVKVATKRDGVVEVRGFEGAGGAVVTARPAHDGGWGKTLVVTLACGALIAVATLPAFRAYFFGEAFLYLGQYWAARASYWRALFSPSGIIFFKPVCFSASLPWYFWLPLL